MGSASGPHCRLEGSEDASIGCFMGNPVQQSDGRGKEEIEMGVCPWLGKEESIQLHPGGGGGRGLCVGC